MRIFAFTWLLAMAALTGCQTLPDPPLSAQAALARAAERIEASDHATAVAVLDHFGEAGLAVDDRARWHLLRGTALFHTGAPSDAFESFEEFVEDSHLPLHAHEFADLTYAIGDALARGPETPWWSFFSNRGQAKNVLGDLVTRYPTHRNVPDALHRLGELAFEDGDYELARERYTQIIYGRHDTVWNTKAAFRVAMTYFRRLEGPEYDLEEMERARAELRDFLATDVENPAFCAEAEQALHTVLEWLAAKHTDIADFYRTVGNEQGFLYHLEIARKEFPGTVEGQRAGQLLAAQAAVAERGS